MPTTTWHVSKDAVIAHQNSGGNYGAGRDVHLPVGYNSWLSGPSRALLGFTYSFSGITSITSATLYMRNATGYHMGPSGTPTLYVERITSSWSEGTAGADEVWNAGNAVVWPGPSCVTTNYVTWEPSITDNAWNNVDVTNLVKDAFTAGVFHGLRLASSNESSSSERLEFWSKDKGTDYDAYISVTYSTNTAPNAPTGLTPTGDSVVNTLLPTFAGTFSDPDAGDSMTKARILLYEDDGTTLKWDSGQFVDTGASFSKTYNGPALTGDTFYKWKAQTCDSAGAWGAYSALQRFKPNSRPMEPDVDLIDLPWSDVKTLTPRFVITHRDADPPDMMSKYRIVVWVASTGSAVWDSGDVTVTATRAKTVTYAGTALTWGETYMVAARTTDTNGSVSEYSAPEVFVMHKTLPPVLESPAFDDITNDTTPTFLASSNDPIAHWSSARVQIYASNGTSLIEDSGTFTSGVAGDSFAWTSPALSAGTVYKWRALATSTIGGTSAWSSMVQFTVLDTNTPTLTTPKGTGVTPQTNLQFTFTRSSATFKYHQLYVYQSDGTTQVTSDIQSNYTATNSKTFTYTGTLSWNTTYRWKVRVSSDGSNWSPWGGLLSFKMDSAGIPTKNAPSSGAWLGAPQVIDAYDVTTSITNGSNAATSIDTAAADKKTGRGSLKIAITSLNSGSSSHTYRTVSKDLSDYGPDAPIKIWVRASTLTNLNYVRLRVTFATSSDYADYAITPGGTAWAEQTLTKGTTTATSGTVNWANVTRIGIVVNAITAAYTGNINVDDLRIGSIAPAFAATTYNSENATYWRVVVYSNSTGTNLVWDSGDTSMSAGTALKMAYGGSTLTRGTVYYWKCRYTKSSGPVGAYTGLTAFTINRAPAAPTGLEPAGDSTIANDLTPTFQASFADGDESTQSDLPSIYEVEVYRNSNSTLAYTLLKDASLNGGSNSVTDGDAGILKVTGAESPLAYEREYKYRARYTDSMGEVGSWSGYLVFKLSERPTTTISTPTDAGTVTSPSFNISWSMSSPGGKGQNSYQVQVVRQSDDEVLYDTDRVYSSATTFKLPAGHLRNNIDYEIRVRTWDTDGLVSSYDVNTVTSNWTAPDAVANFDVSEDAVRSCADLSWSESTLLPADFGWYTIYRKLSTSNTWIEVTTITDQSTTSYEDFYISNNISYNYMITQTKVIVGDADLESSDSDIGTVYLDADSWVVVGADRRTSHIFELPVASGPFVEPVQQEVFEPLGTNRKVIVRGMSLGAEGTLQCRWESDERAEAVTQLNYIKNNAGPHLLKSPFGDLWEVEFSSPSKEYLGGGHINVTLVWTEV